MQNNFTPIMTSLISEDRYEYTQDDGLHNVLFKAKRYIFYIKNNAKNLQNVLKYIESSFSKCKKHLIQLHSCSLIFSQESYVVFGILKIYTTENNP